MGSKKDFDNARDLTMATFKELKKLKSEKRKTQKPSTNDMFNELISD